MISDILQPTHLLFVLVVALLVLGPKRLPEAGRALGKGLRDFRSAISGEDDHHDAIPPEHTPVPPQQGAFPPAATAPPADSPQGPTAPAEHQSAEQQSAEHQSAEHQSAEQQTAHPVG